MSNLYPSVVRTIAPQVASILIVLALRLGIKVDDTTALFIAQQVIALVYYVAVRVLEQMRSSRWGWLLGSPKAPAYFNGSL